jgi:hypothetical protein
MFPTYRSTGLEAANMARRRKKSKTLTLTVQCMYPENSLMQHRDRYGAHG